MGMYMDKPKWPSGWTQKGGYLYDEDNNSVAIIKPSKLILICFKIILFLGIIFSACIYLMVKMI